MATGEMHKERRPHEAKTEPAIVQDAVRNLNSMQVKIAKRELTVLGDEKSALIAEIDQWNQDLADRIKEIILP